MAVLFSIGQAQVLLSRVCSVGLDTLSLAAYRGGAERRLYSLLWPGSSDPAPVQQKRAMNETSEAVVGVWEVHAPDAPFPWHVMTFTPYGTLMQSNPHEGNRQESDSSGHGVWRVVETSVGRTVVIGKFVEFKAHRRSGSYIGKGVIQLKLVVEGNAFSGMSQAYSYDAENRLVKGPLVSPIRGTRVILDAAALLMSNME